MENIIASVLEGAAQHHARQNEQRVYHGLGDELTHNAPFQKEIGASPPTATSPTQIFFVFFLFGIRDSTLTFNQQFLNHQKSMLFL